MTFEIAGRRIGRDDPTYFVADVAANHDGSLDRALELIKLCAEAGADAAKFQHFTAPTIVSDYGFKALGGQQSHQASWSKSVYEVYDEASLPEEWTPRLAQACAEAGIDFFSAPYSAHAIDLLEPLVPAWKVGSGDVTWLDSIRAMAATGKPVLLATGAADIGEVQEAVHAVVEAAPGEPQLCLMQCNTNYTGELDNLAHIHLRVLETYATMFGDLVPGLVLGLSDHTPGHSTVLGSVALGARIVEKHFTDAQDREGPDHGFSMTPDTWHDMVQRTRELELALGSADKRVADNETQTVVLQRRCVRVARDLPAGHVLTADDLEVLRPATPGALLPKQLGEAVGRTLRADMAFGQDVTWADLV